MIENFKNDFFGRKNFAANLLRVIKTQSDYESKVISIKAGFGEGKTFFAKAFKDLIENEKSDNNEIIFCDYINIWKGDYVKNPLLSLLNIFDTIADRHRNILHKNATTKISKSLKKFVGSVPYFGESISKAMEALEEIEDENIFKNLKKYKKVTESIQSAFEGATQKYKIIIIIDEIDRCHPEYAIEFLETLKHFFDIKGLYFILMMNEEHLREKLKSQFGYIDFYLWKDKFIDLEFDLPNDTCEHYITYLIEKIYKCNLDVYDKKNNLEPCIKHKVRQGVKLDKYIYDLLKSIVIKNAKNYIGLNKREINILCLRIHLALLVFRSKQNKIHLDFIILYILISMCGEERFIQDENQGLHKQTFIYKDENTYDEQNFMYYLKDDGVFDLANEKLHFIRAIDLKVAQFANWANIASVEEK